MGIKSSKIAPAEDPLHLDLTLDEYNRMRLNITNTSVHKIKILDDFWIKNNIKNQYIKNIESDEKIWSYASQERVHHVNPYLYTTLNPGEERMIMIGLVYDIWNIKELGEFEIKVQVQATRAWNSTRVKKILHFSLLTTSDLT